MWFAVAGVKHSLSVLDCFDTGISGAGSSTRGNWGRGNARGRWSTDAVAHGEIDI